MHKQMGLDTEGGMDTHVYTYTRYNSKELVFGIVNAQRNNHIGRVELEVHGNIYI